jgi:phosphoribosylglycinamide formyltransferase-1
VRRVDARVAVLASGSGTNLQALLDHPVVGPHVVLVLSDRGEAPALERARAKGVEALFVDPKAFPDRPSFDRALLGALRERDVGFVVLAGFMRIVGPELVRAYAGRMLNLHPALLPSFPGAHGIRDALAWGVKVTGVTVHLVDEEVDHGPIVAQEAVSVLPEDDEATLATRIHEVEHRIYPEAVRALIEGRLEMRGRTVRVLESAELMEESADE